MTGFMPPREPEEAERQADGYAKRLEAIIVKHKLLGWLSWLIIFTPVDMVLRYAWPAQPMIGPVAPFCIAVGFVMLLGWQRMGWIN
jgi:hypothetical protein